MSSQALQDIMDLKKNIEKDFKVSYLIFNLKNRMKKK